MSAKTMAEVIRLELRKGSYQMPGDTLPYETQAATIAAHLTAAGFGLLADAKAEALESAAADAEGMHDPTAPDCKEWADWLRARAKTVSTP